MPQASNADPLKHAMVPGHEVLKEDEAAKVLEKFDIQLQHLPKIKYKDAALVALRDIYGVKMQEGDVIKITRNSHTAGIFIAYRVVVMK